MQECSPATPTCLSAVQNCCAKNPLALPPSGLCTSLSSCAPLQSTICAPCTPAWIITPPADPQPLLLSSSPILLQVPAQPKPLHKPTIPCDTPAPLKLPALAQCMPLAMIPCSCGVHPSHPYLTRFGTKQGMELGKAATHSMWHMLPQPQLGAHPPPFPHYTVQMNTHFFSSQASKPQASAVRKEQTASYACGPEGMPQPHAACMRGPPLAPCIWTTPVQNMMLFGS